MRSKILFIVMSIFFIQCKGIGQNNIESEVRSFLISQKEFSPEQNATIYIAELLTNKKYSGGDGIYRFVVLGSHKLPFMCFVKNGQINILEKYKMENVLNWFVSYLDVNKNLKPLEKTVLLGNLAKVLSQRETILEETSIDEDIERQE